MATITMLSGGAPKPVFEKLVPLFEKDTGHKVTIVYAVMSAINEKLAANDIPDILVMPAPLLDGLEKSGTVRGNARVLLGNVAVAMVGREGGPAPDISTKDKFCKTMLAARSLAHPTPGETPSGTHMGKLMVALGLAEPMKGRIHHLPALKGGVKLVQSGEAEFGIYPISEISNIPGLQVIARLPDELQIVTVYGAGVTTKAAAADAATALIKFLSSPAQSGEWAHAGFDPPKR